MFSADSLFSVSLVALLAEGVDRNLQRLSWTITPFVALLAEGVDRNPLSLHLMHRAASGRPPRGGRG